MTYDTEGLEARMRERMERDIDQYIDADGDRLLFAYLCALVIGSVIGLAILRASKVSAEGYRPATEGRAVSRPGA